MTLAPSRHNLVATLEDTGEPAIVNVLAGTADLLSQAEAAALARGEPMAGLEERGYLVNPDDEMRRYRAAYLDFLDARDRDEVQLFFAPTYACNFACSYCYQSEYETETPLDGEAVVGAFYRYVDSAFAGRRVYVTLFGGEPLLPGERHHGVIAALVQGAKARGLDIAVVTNGYLLDAYLDGLTQARIREIQVTLDGVGPLHDRRRPLRGGGATFERVLAGIEAALARKVPVNLRVVVDRENLKGLVELARFAQERGWTRNPLVKTQLGRNYELHYCQVERARLYTRVELHRQLYALLREHPEVLELHRPAFALARGLATDGTLPPPLFDACPGCKTEWAFDARGRIYACTATVGKPGEELGTFYPEVQLDAATVRAWQERDVLTIAACRDCPAQLACGGGCAAVAKRRTGDLHAPDCRPVAELLGLGLALYAPKVENEAPTVSACCCTAGAASTSCG
jgi:uncharacterized protein